MVPKTNRQIPLSRTQGVAAKREEIKQTVLKEREITKRMEMEIQARTQSFQVQAITATLIHAAGTVMRIVADLINQIIRSRNRRRLSCLALAYSLSESAEL